MLLSGTFPRDTPHHHYFRGIYYLASHMRLYRAYVFLCFEEIYINVCAINRNEQRNLQELVHRNYAS